MVSIMAKKLMCTPCLRHFSVSPCESSNPMPDVGTYTTKKCELLPFVQILSHVCPSIEAGSWRLTATSTRRYCSTSISCAVYLKNVTQGEGFKFSLPAWPCFHQNIRTRRCTCFHQSRYTWIFRLIREGYACCRTECTRRCSRLEEWEKTAMKTEDLNHP